MDVGILLSLPPDWALTDQPHQDFLQHAVAVVTSGTRTRDAAKYDILYGPQTSADAGEPAQLEVLTPSKWLKLLGSDGFENNTFHLKAKSRARSRSRRPYYHERRSPLYSGKSSDQESPRPRAPLPAPTRYRYSKDTGRGPTHNNKELTVYRGGQEAINRVDYETIPGPVFVREPHDHRRGLENDQDRRITRDIVVRGRSEARRESPSNPIEHGEMIRRGRSSSTEIRIRWRGGRDRWPRRREREYDSNSNDTPAAEQEMPPLDDTGAATVNPFFSWRVKSMADVDTVRTDQKNIGTSPMADVAIHDLFRILGKINESLLSSESGIKEVYSQAYKCTEENLLKRHPNLAREIVPSSNTSPTVQRDSVGQGKEADQEKKGGSTDNSSTQPPTTFPPDGARAGSTNQEQETVRQEKAEPSKIGEKQAPATPRVGAQEAARHSTSDIMTHPAEAFGKKLVEISQAIMHRFLPKDEHSVYHPVCERFWGSVDEIIRVSTQRPAFPGLGPMHKVQDSNRAMNSPTFPNGFSSKSDGLPSRRVHCGQSEISTPCPALQVEAEG